MTLIVSYIDPSYAIQVSDRRVTFLDAQGRIQRKDDQSNKAVLWSNRLAFGFTGIANLGMERRTDRWLARQILEWEEAQAAVGDRNPASLLETIAERATEYFDGPRLSRVVQSQRCHAFGVVGWATFPGNGDFEPYLVELTNFPNREWRGGFVGRIGRLPNSHSRLWGFLGQSVSTEMRADLRRALDALNPGADDYPHRVVSVLAQLVRRIAAENELVGKGLQIIVMPRSTIKEGQSGGMYAAGGPMNNEQTFLYVPPDGDTSTFYGPSMVVSSAVVGDFEMTEGIWK